MKNKQWEMVGNRWFGQVEIETTTVCNRKCKYCPQSKIDRGNHFMKEEMFKKIIHDLKDVDYTGIITFHVYGEPLMNPKIFDYIEYANKNLKFAMLIFFTNGVLLTSEKIKRLFDLGISEINVTEHTGKFNPVISEFKEKYPFLSDKLKYAFFPNSGTRIMNRGGIIKKEDLPDGSDFSNFKDCGYINGMLEINYKGDVILCCQDYEGKYVFGNVMEENLCDIWFKNMEYVRLRTEISQGVYQLDICKKCVRLDENSHFMETMLPGGKWVKI